MAARTLLVAALAVVLVTFAAADGSIDSEIDHLEGECLEEINELWEKYTEGPAVEGCDEACLRECYQILQDAVWGTKNKNCPLQSEIQRCFHVFSDDWEDYVKECELFVFQDSESESEGESSSSEGESSSSEGESPPSEGEAEAPSSGEAEAPASSESESSPSSESESSPSSESSEDKEKEEDEEHEAAGEGEAHSPPSPSEGEATTTGGGKRRLLSEAEAEGVAGEGCFPPFEDAEDFEKYIDGNWDFEGSSNAAGIALSCVFFVGLAGLALFLKT